MKNIAAAEPDASAAEEEGETARGSAGALTLMRGLDVLDRVARGDNTLGKIAKSLGLNKSTVHRLATTLVEMKYLILTPRDGYSLGAKLLELGWAASQQITITRIAHPFLLKLAADTGDTVNLGVLDNDQVHYIDKIPGTRRIQVRCVIGERQPLRPTGLGKALLIDADEDALREVYMREARDQPQYRYDLKSWLAVMKDYAAEGYALDLDENEDRIRCVAAPIRDMTGRIAAAISVSSAQQYMDDARMRTLREYVKDAALAISRELGYSGD
jgi:DNA-binding IclR family transcriptional regulator